MPPKTKGMNTKVFLLTIAVLLQSSVLMAGTIRGKVVDASTGEEIIGVTILLKTAAFP